MFALNLTGTIGRDFSAASVQERLGSAAGKKVVALLSATGSWWREAMAIHEAINAHPDGVEIVVRGQNAGAAALVMLAGRPVSFMPDATVAIEMPPPGASMSYRDVLKIYEERGGAALADVACCVGEITARDASSYGYGVTSGDSAINAAPSGEEKAPRAKSSVDWDEIVSRVNRRIS